MLMISRGAQILIPARVEGKLHGLKILLPIDNCRQQTEISNLTTDSANKQLVLTTATADIQLHPIPAAGVPLRQGPADYTRILHYRIHA